MNPFLSAITPQLQAAGVSDDQFQLLLGRLLDFGVLNRSHSQVEQQHYDIYVRVPELVADYFACVGVRLLHEPRFEALRLIPPGAQVPGVADEHSPFNGGMRAKLNQQEIAIVLTLRCEYEKCLREGRVDEQGAVMVSLENLALAIKQLLGRSLPDNISERRLQLRRLRQLRVIDIPNDEKWQEQDEPWLLVRPAIVSLVSDDVLNSLLDDPLLDDQPETRSTDASTEVSTEVPTELPEAAEASKETVPAVSNEILTEDAPSTERTSVSETLTAEALDKPDSTTESQSTPEKPQPAPQKPTENATPSVAANFPSDLFADMEPS